MLRVVRLLLLLLLLLGDSTNAGPPVPDTREALRCFFFYVQRFVIFLTPTNPPTIKAVLSGWPLTPLIPSLALLYSQCT